MMALFSPPDAFFWLLSLWRHGRAARMTREQLEALQLRKFRRLVSYANKHSPYYRRIIAERGIDPAKCVPTDFPVLTKQDIARHFDHIVTDSRIKRDAIIEFIARTKNQEGKFLDKYHAMNTSGSSGELGCFVYSHQEWISAAGMGTRIAPIRWRQKIAYLGVVDGHSAGANLARTGNQGLNRLFYNMRIYSVQRPMDELIDDLNAFQPRVLIGYATMIKELAEAQQQGRLRIRPKRVVSGAEPLPPAARALAEEVFQTPVRSIYGTTEHLYTGLTLQGSDGIHLMEDDLIFELHEDHTCITNLFNFTMPLIRYRMSDVLVSDPRPRDDHYPYVKIRDVLGRQENSLIFTNEAGVKDFIHPLVVVEIAINGLKSWQLVLEDLSFFRFLVCVEEDASESEQQAIKEEIARYWEQVLIAKRMRNVRFQIEVVGELPVDTKTGKFRIVVKGAGYQGWSS
jgi:putative adenylate-forming enzyme